VIATSSEQTSQLIVDDVKALPNWKRLLPSPVIGSPVVTAFPKYGARGISARGNAAIFEIEIA
jgi:hypothetical protein